MKVGSVRFSPSRSLARFDAFFVKKANLGSLPWRQLFRGHWLAASTNIPNIFLYARIWGLFLTFSKYSPMFLLLQPLNTLCQCFTRITVSFKRQIGTKVQPWSEGGFISPTLAFRPYTSSSRWCHWPYFWHRKLKLTFIVSLRDWRSSMLRRRLSFENPLFWHYFCVL